MFLFGRFLIQALTGSAHGMANTSFCPLFSIPANSAFDTSLNHDLMSMPDKGRDPSPHCHRVYWTEIEARADEIVKEF